MKFEYWHYTFENKIISPFFLEWFFNIFLWKNDFRRLSRITKQMSSSQIKIIYFLLFLFWVSWTILVKFKRMYKWKRVLKLFYGYLNFSFYIFFGYLNIFPTFNFFFPIKIFLLIGSVILSNENLKIKQRHFYSKIYFKI